MDSIIQSFHGWPKTTEETSLNFLCVVSRRTGWFHPYAGHNLHWNSNSSCPSDWEVQWSCNRSVVVTFVVCPDEHNHFQSQCVRVCFYTLAAIADVSSSGLNSRLSLPNGDLMIGPDNAGLQWMVPTSRLGTTISNTTPWHHNCNSLPFSDGFWRAFARIKARWSYLNVPSQRQSFASDIALLQANISIGTCLQ